VLKSGQQEMLKMEIAKNSTAKNNSYASVDISNIG